MLDFAEYIVLCEELTDELALGINRKLRKFIGTSEHSRRKNIHGFIDMMKKGIAIHHGSKMPLKSRLIMGRFCKDLAMQRFVFNSDIVTR